MGYRQLTIEERCEIARLRAEGAPLREIAAALDRAPSTIARELNRNSTTEDGYRPRYADQQAALGAGAGRGWNETRSCAPTFWRS